MDPHGPTQVSVEIKVDKIKHIHFQKESKNIFLSTISVLPLCSQSAQSFQPLAMWAEPWQAIPGVSMWVITTVRRGYTLQFTRRPPRFRGVLTTTVRSENAQVVRAEVRNLLEKGAIEIIPPAQSESGFLQPLLPRPQKRRRPVTYSKSQTPELRPDEKVFQDDNFETGPPANIPRGLVHVAGSERRVLSHPGSPPSHRILEIRIQRGGISIQGPAVWLIPGSPHFYTILSPLCDKWESAYSTTWTTGSFCPSRRQFWHHTRPSSSAT